MEWYEEEVQALERARSTNGTPLNPFVFYGSSSIRLWTTLAYDFPTLKPLNLGFGGSTLEACVWFFERLIVPYRPRYLVVYAGDNDLGDGQPANNVIRSFRALVDKIKTYLGETPVSFMSIKPSPARMNLLDAIIYTNETIKADIARNNTLHYVDIFHAMLDDNRQPRQELYAEDGLHLSPAGYRLWKHILTAHLFPDQRGSVDRRP